MQKGRTRARHVGGDGGGKTQDSSQQEEQKDKAGDGTWMWPAVWGAGQDSGGRQKDVVAVENGGN